MGSVNSRDIKCAVSRLHHLPGFFVFSMFTFFSCDFYATFFGEQPVWVPFYHMFKALFEPLIFSQPSSWNLESDF